VYWSTAALYERCNSGGRIAIRYARMRRIKYCAGARKFSTMEDVGARNLAASRHPKRCDPSNALARGIVICVTPAVM
jgi:hypothetical protein